MSAANLQSTALALVAEGKGVMAADESGGTIKKRFDSIQVDSTEANRRDYRELLFATPGLGDHISGVILFDETLRQDAADGTPLVEILQNAGIIPGIKVDKGAKPLAGHPDETVTEGLDGLRERLEEYAELGARFAKWRAVYRVGDATPSTACITANAHALARYAALSQEAGLVPIVEPEVLMDGDHDIDDCEIVTEEVLRTVFAELALQDVLLEGMLLKPNMVISGTECAEQAGVEEVAERSLRCLLRSVPAAMPGIVFLSGGMSDEAATRHLDAMNKLTAIKPWKLSFSYGRAMQAAPLKAWGGKAENAAATQAALMTRAEANGAATLGKYA
jgi:fructose-bisphosphate aldolase class I